MCVCMYPHIFKLFPLHCGWCLTKDRFHIQFHKRSIANIVILQYTYFAICVCARACVVCLPVISHVRPTFSITFGIRNVHHLPLQVVDGNVKITRLDNRDDVMNNEVSRQVAMIFL